MSFMGRKSERFHSSVVVIPRSSLDTRFGLPVSFRNRFALRSSRIGAYVSRAKMKHHIAATPAAIESTQKIQRQPSA